MIIVVSSSDDRINGGVFEYADELFYVISANTQIIHNGPYTYNYLKDIFGDFTYKELLFG
jgi:hypothetical protein